MVLAADSAAMVVFPQHGPKVDGNACKMANLYRGKPNRRRLNRAGRHWRAFGGDAHGGSAGALDGPVPEGGLDPEAYTVESVAGEVASLNRTTRRARRPVLDVAMGSPQVFRADAVS